MKQELHICDRCGETIELVPENSRFRTLIQKNRRIPAHISKEICERNGYVTEEFLKSPEISSASIVKYYNFERSEYDLCHKCRKDFERFMRNETINTRNSAKSG